ncbi:MAG: chromosome segregation protein SMC [Pseudomonadales bacterium]
MRLKSIKLAGFKSFVDPTTVQFPNNLTAVVGPNGCGKSNIIDAVRWVMGESSAKTLRGDSMADVIFSGSSARMPVGQASIELIFDNSDGSLTGEYGTFSEISIRRLVTRELQSTYFLNGSKCRRRDIQDIFLGTGLGPRSYSIIEQGTISRFVEAKPEELRHFIEEAAGISKYKERRRETENRIRRTKENLDRLSDIREEMDRQLHHLQRQARAAQQYSELKQQERSNKAELLAIRWRALDDTAVAQEKQVGEQEVQLEAVHAEQRHIETNIEKQRAQQTELSDVYQQVQEQLYLVGTEIARQEQNIQHQQQRAKQLNEELLRTETSKMQTANDLQNDELKTATLQEQLLELEPEIELLSETELQSAEQLELAETTMQQWQHSWDEFNQQAAEPRQRAEVEQSRIQHMEQAIVKFQQRIDKLQQEKTDFSDEQQDSQLLGLQEHIAEIDERAEQHKSRVSELVTTIDQQRETNQALSQTLDQARRLMQELQGRHGSLEALQQAALGKTDAPVVQWLEKNQLHRLPRLAQNLSVKEGWERALETVLGHHLQGVCVEQANNLMTALDNLSQGSITLLNPDQAKAAPDTHNLTSLQSKVDSSWNIASLLSGIYVVDELADALVMRDQLAAHESIVCKDGMWLGSGWIRVTRESDEQASVLGRQQELLLLDEQIAVLDETIEVQSVDLDAGLLQLKNSEHARETGQQELNDLLRQHGELTSQLSAKQARIEQLNTRRQQLTSDLDEHHEQLVQEQEKLAESRLSWQQALEAVELDVERKEELLQQRDGSRTLLDDIRQRARHDKELAHQAALKKQSVCTQLDALGQGIERLRSQLQNFNEQQTLLHEQMAESAMPLDEIKETLEIQLEKRLLLDEKLRDARVQVEKVNHELSQLETKRHQSDQRLEAVRNQLESSKLEAQGLRVQRENLVNQLREMKQNLHEILLQLSADADVSAWENTLTQLQNKIQRLGAINLAAIDEYKTQSERKTYLDAQNDDLVEALETLESAIRKIDRETRTKFKETFDKVNKGLQDLFPKVFGGGHAYLELTGEDLLDTGVTIMARPPGKRNSTIQLLSGGEKALTAISLVFSIFQLNPAPFCMLDEVDAPLDDANVERFCRIVKEMSESVQFIYITHNKVTMEMASHMMGVTMLEPGVSRLVSVNVDEAAELIQV